MTSVATPFASTLPAENDKDSEVNGLVDCEHLPPDQVGGLPHPAAASVYVVALAHVESSNLGVIQSVGAAVVSILQAAKLDGPHPAALLTSVGPKEVVKVFQSPVEMVPSENQAMKAPSPSYAPLLL